MNTRRRLVNYIILNIFVSAAVTGTILFFYHRLNKPDCGSSLPVVTAAPGGMSADILGVSGVGSAASEVVTLQNNGPDAIVLTGWTIKDDQGTTFTFPQVTLYPGAALKVHTAAGKDTPSDLYWGRTSPVWEAGELAAVYDTQNVARAFYRIP